MKKWYVYELVNLMGTVEYVGETSNPTRRLNEHIKYKSNGQCNRGKFLGRVDIFMNIVKEFNNRSEAWHYQCDLQLEYGLKSDKVNSSNAGKLGGKTSSKNNMESGRLAELRSLGGIKSSSIIKKCPHCSYEGKMPTIFRLHFDRCKYKKTP